MHDGFTNKISFQQHDQKIILKPLSPREVCDDQIGMREKREQEKENQRGRKKKNNERNEKKKACFLSQPILRQEGDARLNGASSKEGKRMEL